jgi:hypothetical protein
LDEHARRATTRLADGLIVTVDATAGVVLEGRIPDSEAGRPSATRR